MLGPILQGRLVTLAPFGPEHLEHYCRWFADAEVTRYLARDVPPSLRQEQEWYERVCASQTDVVWGLFVDGQHVGSSGLHAIDWRHRRATTGTLIGDRAWWGRGVGGESMRLRTRYAFDELGLETLHTQVVVDNVASRRGLERAGYRTVGVYHHYEFRAGRWHDTWLGELLRADWLARSQALAAPAVIAADDGRQLPSADHD